MSSYFYIPYSLKKSFLHVFDEVINSPQIETNVGLFLDKYVFFIKNNKNKESKESSQNLKLQLVLLQNLFKKDKSIDNNLSQDNRKNLINLLLSKPNPTIDKDIRKFEAGTRLSIPSDSLPKKHYKSFVNRKKRLYDDLKCMGYIVEEITSKSVWRVLINFGSESVYETSLLFDRNYSIPFIPGSAVKGVTRHYAQYILQEANTPIFTEIFGDDNKKESGKGKVIFFDAYPIIENDRDFIVLDILNVHYQKYYTDRKEFGDWMQPTPIFFLAIEKGTKFNFVLAGKNQKLVDKAKEYLTNAIREIGIGAKTSSGYGYFEVAKC